MHPRTARLLAALCLFAMSGLLSRRALAQTAGADSGAPSDAAEQKARAQAQVRGDEERSQETERVRDQRPSAAPAIQPPVNELPPAQKAEVETGTRSPIAPSEPLAVTPQPVTPPVQKLHRQTRVAPPQPVQKRQHLPKPPP